MGIWILVVTNLSMSLEDRAKPENMRVVALMQCKAKAKNLDVLLQPFIEGKTYSPPPPPSVFNLVIYFSLKVLTYWDQTETYSHGSFFLYAWFADLECLYPVHSETIDLWVVSIG